MKDILTLKDFYCIAQFADSVLLLKEKKQLVEDRRVLQVNLSKNDFYIDNVDRFMKFTPFEDVGSSKSLQKYYRAIIYRSLPDETIVDMLLSFSGDEVEKSEEEDILKAWQSAQIGEIRQRKDGKKYRKVANTGSEKDWQLVTQPKTGKKEENKGSKSKKSDDNNNTQLSKEDLSEHAKNTSETSLQNAVKQSPDPEVRQAAHEELQRRESEEKPQEEETKRDIDKKQSERKISFEEYKKDFLDFSEKSPKELSDFYSDERESVRGYFSQNYMIEKALDFYIEDGFEQVRNYLTSGDVEEKDHNLRDGFSITVNKNNIKGLTSSISKFINDNKISKSISLNRRVKGNAVDFFKSLKKGDTYEDKSFSSSSLRELGHFGDFNIEILAKRGSSVANIDNIGEYEYLIDKDSKFRVLDTHKDGIIVELL